MKASILFYPNKLKKSRKSGLTPIYVRVLLHGKKAEGRLYEAGLSDNELSLWEESTMRLRVKHHKANLTINDVQADFDDFIAQNRRNMHAFSAMSIRDHLLGHNQQSSPTLTAYIDQYYSSSIADNTNIAVGTKKCYQKAMRHLKALSRPEKNLHFLMVILLFLYTGE